MKYIKKLPKILLISMIFLITVLICYMNKRRLYINEINEPTLDELMKVKSEFEKGIINTYYISSSGTSKDGKNINDPMSLEEAMKKQYHAYDKILFKCGDVFFGNVSFNISAEDGTLCYIGNYGDGDLPIIKGSKIIKNMESWKKISDFENIYYADLTDIRNLDGIRETSEEFCNIGFIEDTNGNIYASRKKSIDLLLDEYDFYCDGKSIYIKSYDNPFLKLGELELAVKTNLFAISNNVEIEGICLENVGAHGFYKKSYPLKNVYVHNCIIRDIGGSVQNEEVFSRYGNGIEFWNGAENIIIEDNLIKNVYDAAITLQGNSGNFNNIDIKGNIIISNCYSFELWSSENGQGMKNVSIHDNIIANQGMSWGQGVRPNPYNSAEYVFYTFSNSAEIGINIYNNKHYNSLRMYYILSNIKDRFKNEINIDNNYFRNVDDVYVVNYIKSKEEKQYLNEEYNIDKNSEFRLISDIEADKISNPDILNSNNYDEIKSYYENLEVQFKYADGENEIIDKYNEKKDKYLNNEDIVTSIDNIVKKLENVRDGKSIVTAEEVGGFIRNNYEIADNVLDRTGSELVEIVKDIDEVAKGYAKLFELNSVNSVDGIDGLNAKMDNTNALLYYYKDRIELFDLEELVILAVEHYAEDSVIGYFQSEHIIDIVDKIINERIDEYNLNSVSIEYSTNTFTNQEVVARLVSASKDIEMSYGDTYTFDKNGMFAFKYVYKGEERELIATVDWIDKAYPEFVGINDRFDEMEPVTINVVDENLDSIVATKDGQAIQLNNGDTLIEVGSYVVTATDKAGNKVIAEFRIVDYIESNKEYYISPDGNGDGLSKNSPMNVSDASKIRYYAGDKILFKSGERYNIDLNWYMMGAMEKNVTISSYDDGDMPVINGSIELVSNLNISGIRFTNSSESCLITNQMYNENIAVFDCVFENIDDTAIFLNKQVSNININNCIFRNCGKSGIAIKNDDKSFIAQNVLIRDNMFIGMDNMIAISGDFADESFENVQVCDNYFVNQKGDNAIISFGSIVDTKFDVKLFNNFYYNFEAGYSADKRYMEALKNNLVSENNTWYAVKNSRILNESVEFEKLHNDYNIENNSKFVVMNPLGYQISLIEVIASDSYDKNEVIAYILETIRMSSENKKVEDIDVETGAVTVTSGYEAFLGSKVGSGAELTEKNSQEKIEDVTIAEVDIPLAGWKRIAFGIVAIALVGAIVSGVKNAKYWKEENRR